MRTGIDGCNDIIRKEFLDIMDKLNQLIEEINWTNVASAIISDKKNKELEISKIKLRSVQIKDTIYVQVTEYIDKKVIHTNVEIEDIGMYVKERLEHDFKQAQIETSSAMYNVLISKKGQVTVKKKSLQTEKMPILMHNRTKEYIIKEGEPVDFLIELGVMNEKGYVLRPKYDKFRQINRFLEFVQDIVERLPKERTIKIIDFGCGKSYLTFAIYYYLHNIKKMNVEITGLDLKKDVINTCNELAGKLRYDGLNFLMGDIADYNDASSVDMVVTLHACDTATDYALAKAVGWNASVILSVPCCQHEVNKQIENELLSPVLDYGILKERMSALITDGIRAKTLEEHGYETQILEFIDMEHTPKNLMIRAVKKHSKKSSDDKLASMIEALNIKPTIKELL